jgi:mono/diheme cytochrome c family protein
MTTPDRGRRTADLLFAGGSVVLAALLFVALAGKREQAGVLAFMGRLHPLAVHLPIGLCLLVGLLEVSSISPRLRARTDPALSLVLPLALASAVVAFALGLVLASEGGHPERLLRLHRQLAFGTVLGSALSVVTWSMHAEARVPRLVHRVAVCATLVLLGAGAHFGGSMTHGESYLIERAPSFVRRWIGGGAPVADTAPRSSTPTSDRRVFDDVLLPVLEQKCAGCHGAVTTRGQLRLDGFEALMKGGKTGPAVRAGDAKGSVLMRRIATPIAEDGHMPPEGEPQLTPEEIELIAFWIDSGASPTTKVRDLLVPEGARRLLVERSTERARDVEPTASGTSRSPAATKGAADAAPRDPVEPLLAAKCGGCHGASKQEGELRTDSAQDRGRLLARIRLPEDDDRHMPPRDAPQLDASELRLLTRWLSRGVAVHPRPPSSAASTTAQWIERDAIAAGASEAPADRTQAREGHLEAPKTTSEDIRVRARGGCAGCALNGAGDAERPTFALGAALLAVLALRRSRS